MVSGPKLGSQMGVPNWVPNLLFIGSQEAVKKIWAKNRICLVKKGVEREKYSLLKQLFISP
jgi:hypothetical protein